MFGIVQLNHRAVCSDLIERVHAANGFGDLSVGRWRRPFFARLAAETEGFVAVAQLPSFMFPGAGAAGNSGTADRADRKVQRPLRWLGSLSSRAPVELEL